MSLLRLLTTGRSLVSVRDTESRYRLTTQRLLPQFGPTRNPFGSPARQEPSSVGTSRPPAELGEVSPKGEGRGHARGFWLRLVGLWSACKVKPGALIVRPFEKTATQASPQLPKRPVQGELSLDRIKVVRNDLTDADLEVVPATRMGPTPAVLGGKTVARAEWSWRQVTSRLFPADKGQWGQH